MNDIHERDPFERFRRIFLRGAVNYGKNCPTPLKLILEFSILIIAFSSLVVLIERHAAHYEVPLQLKDVQVTWPRQGILRVEIVKTSNPDYDLNMSYQKEDILKGDEHVMMDTEHSLTKASYEVIRDEYLLYKDIFRKHTYIVEYALENDLLTIDKKVRDKLNIPVMFITLNQDTDEYFGSKLSRFLFGKVLGYDEFLKDMIKSFVVRENEVGYLKNVLSGKIVTIENSWFTKYTSAIEALLNTVFFTLSLSLVVTYCHCTIHRFLNEVFFNGSFNELGPLFISILISICIQNEIEKYFNNGTTARYLIMIIWCANKYDALLCYSSITKRNWLKFFYLYTYMFYAYHSRFKEQYNNLALLTSGLFIFHSMVYFFHHYDLPLVLTSQRSFNS